MSSEKEILALEDKRFAAMIGGDWKTVQGLAHDQLLYTHSSGITDTKASWVESIESCAVAGLRDGPTGGERAVDRILSKIDRGG